MSDFSQFDIAKLMIAASVRHCRLTIEELPVGQIVVDQFGTIRSIDNATKTLLSLESGCGKPLTELLVEDVKQFPRPLSLDMTGDLGEWIFCSVGETRYCARLVCVPGPHPQTFLLSVLFY